MSRAYSLTAAMAFGAAIVSGIGGHVDLATGWAATAALQASLGALYRRGW